MIYRYRSLTRKYRHLAILNNASAAMDLLPFDVKVFGPGFSHWDAENVGKNTSVQENYRVYQCLFKYFRP